MGLFDKFKSSPTAPKGYAPVKVEFTEEEARAIGHALRRYSEIFNADAPEGTEAIVTHKMHDAMKANGLVEYVEDLMLQLQDVPEADYPEIIDKAIRAQMKAYAMHNLPVYLYQIAGMFELLGNDAKAREFFALFLQAQNGFSADDVDMIFLKQSGFDMDQVVLKAQQKLAR